jgi:hypothetical protein
MASKPKKSKHRHLLIDGDIVAFVAAASAQDTFLNDHGWMEPRAHTIKGEYGFKHGLNADSFEVIITDPQDNWRRSVDPTYKTNRTDTRPQLLDYLKAYLVDRYDAYFWPGLEADDVLGIKMTTPPEAGDPDREYICVGRDKDFKSIPGLHHSYKQDVDLQGRMLIREVTQWEADRFHLIQTLAGDAVDGFHGCKRIGMKRAAEIIDNPVRLTPQEGVITRGINKGSAVTKWVSEPTSDYWACIVSHYRKAGMTEEDAIVTARLARILRYGEYDLEAETMKLWEPAMLRGVGK